MGKKMLMIEGKHDYDLKECKDCWYSEQNVTCWCTSEEAFNLRQTKQCGMQQCPFWKPCLHLKDLKKPGLMERTFYNPHDKYQKIKGI